jgi:selenocysteine lyase/cysteine desulfurase
MYKKYYSEFLKGHKDVIHLAAHSHHFWPDVTKEAVIKSWEDSANLSDHKWENIFTNILPQTQAFIGEILNFKRTNDITFAPNAHELVTRLLSCVQEKEECKILTTSSEFHSFNRQVDRLNELSNIEVEKLDNEESNFEQNFLNSINNQTSLIFISQVFYNSGKSISIDFIKKIIEKKSKESIVCIDGYHAFCAVPTDLSQIQDDIFYLAGGYKYAQAGEGCCFMTLPKECKLRPINTGWFANFAKLEDSSTTVDYASDGFRFWGSTQDLTPLYRFNSVWNMFLNDGLNITNIHNYIQSLQIQFLKLLDLDDLFLNTDLDNQGHFLTVEFKGPTNAQQAHDDLKKLGILTDFRGSRLRFGFGLYLVKDDIEAACTKIKPILNKFN